MTCDSDLLIIGGGPAGLSAAINGASEGLSVRMLDAGFSLGGQARESAAIENYPGFPDGTTGNDLMSSFVRQALKFSTKMICPLAAAHLQVDGKNFIITTDDYQEYVTKTLLLSLGLSYRRLGADGIGPLMGRGVFYGRPSGVLTPSKKCNVAVIGGANSAGQAVVKLAESPNINIKLIIRKTIGYQMSAYLVNRIKALPNVEVLEGCEVVKVEGTTSLESICIQCGENLFEEKVEQMFIFIGATPRTLWLNGSGIELDDHRYVLSWTDTNNKEALPYETSIKGIFVAGDVRANSIKRIASAIGEGVGALSMIHKHIASMEVQA